MAAQTRAIRWHTLRVTGCPGRPGSAAALESLGHALYASRQGADIDQNVGCCGLAHGVSSVVVLGPFRTHAMDPVGSGDLVFLHTVRPAAGHSLAVHWSCLEAWCGGERPTMDPLGQRARPARLRRQVEPTASVPLLCEWSQPAVVRTMAGCGRGARPWFC